MSRIVAKNVADTIRMLSLNSPDGLNLLNSQFFHELHTQFLRVSKDSAVRVVIMNATNAALFCAGLDMKKGLSEDMLDKKSKSEAQDNLNLLNMIDVAQQAVSMLEMCRVPVIAAVHGKCLGGGVDLITAADMRICTKDAVFSVMETRVGITADLGTLQRISRIVGEGRAREFAFTGREIGSDEALRCGLVNAVYKDQSEMNTAAEQLAQQIACNSPLAVQGTKKILNALHQDTTAKSLELVRMWNTMTLRSNDLREAMAAFQDKRPPVFTEHIPLPPDRMECAPAPRM